MAHRLNLCGKNLNLRGNVQTGYGDGIMGVSKAGGTSAPTGFFFTPSGYGNIHYRDRFGGIYYSHGGGEKPTSTPFR